MLVISSGSNSPTTVRLFSLTCAGDIPTLPLPAYHAPALHPQARTYAIVTASAAVDRVPAYTVVDCHSDGAAVYTAPRYSLVPALTDWQAEVIAAVRHLRRWRLYSDSPTD
jgi:hypothetical protein